MSTTCPSCGTPGQEKAHCEACGYALQKDDLVSDSALSLMMGLVCVACDTYNDPGTSACVQCGTALVLDDGAEPSAPLPAAPAPTPSLPAQPAWMAAPSGKPLSTAQAMPKVDLALVQSGAVGMAAPRAEEPKTSPPPPSLTPAPLPAPLPPPSAALPSSAAPSSSPPCWRCGTSLSDADKFCRNCGARRGEGQPLSTMQIQATPLKMPPPAAASGGATMMMPSFGGLVGGDLAPAPKRANTAPSATMFFGAATVERTAKLILVRGPSTFGSQWRLQAGETVVGRSEGMVLFPDDASLAPRHCRLTFRGAELWLVPEPTTNGVYVRLREASSVQPGDEFVVGAQRLRVLTPGETPVRIENTRNDGTQILGSLVRSTPPILLHRVSADGVSDEVYARAQRLLTLGRAGCDVNFPGDGFVSERHAQLSHEGTHLILEDLKSRNGTYLRARSPRRLVHGDLILMGDEVLRVELPQS